MRWHHSIDLGGGLVTPGLSHRFFDLEQRLPDVTGRTVLDIGAWDGLYSFLAEQRGARRVVALDHYAWGVDLHARQQYWDRCTRAGMLPDPDRDEREFWDPGLSGRRPFELAREALHSSVEPVVADFMTVDLETLGVFDVVLYLGVLYHMREPLTALTRVRAVTGSVAVIETEAVHLPGRAGETLLRFLPGSELGGDYGNWYVPSEAALRALCRAAGFRSVETIVGRPRARGGSRLRRAAHDALAGARRRRPTQPYRLAVLARV